MGLDAKIVEFRDSSSTDIPNRRSFEIDELLRRSEKPHSAKLVTGILRLWELVVVGASGAVAYNLLLMPMIEGAMLRYYSTVAIGVVFVAALFHILKIYTRDYVFSRRLRFDRVLLAWVAVASALIIVAFGLKISGQYSRMWAGTWFVSTAVLLVFGRAVFSRWARSWSEAGRFADRTIIVGAGEQGQKLAARLREDGEHQTRVVGFVDDRRTRLCQGADRDQLLGNTDDLIQYIRGGLIDQVFVALPWSAEERVNTIVHSLALTPVRIHLAPDLAGFEFPDRTYDRIAGVSMLRLFDRPLTGGSHVIKMAEDRILGLLFSIFLAPLMLLIAIAIKLDSRGPVLFKQLRLGFNNAQFEVWKFRTMFVDMSDADGAVQTTKHDTRVTRVGAFLRKSSLDELPQFLNVLAGNMSIVGPRPHALGTKAEGHLFEHVVDRYAARHKVKPGITGWAQVNGWRGETDTIEKIRHRVEHDLYYIDNWSLWLDLRIMLKTAVVMLRDDNAY